MTLRSRFSRARRVLILRVLLGMAISSSVMGAGVFAGRTPPNRTFAQKVAEKVNGA
jgi:hypothetical protein